MVSRRGVIGRADWNISKRSSTNVENGERRVLNKFRN
jgi:hypothetical protein